MHTDDRGFSVLEMIMVVVFLGILAAFALPNYGKALQKTDERKAIGNLVAIRAAVKMYMANTYTTVLPTWATVTDINTNLNLDILDTNMVYSCGPWNGNTCSATHPSGWSIGFHGTAGPHNTDGSIHCDGGTCPSCPNGGAGSCG